MDSSTVNSRVLARELLLGIEHRGKDATGAAWLATNGTYVVQKAPYTASEFVKRLSVQKKARTCVMHTRLGTQGTEKNNDNNHPVSFGPIIGVHNGMLDNDDKLFRDMDLEAWRVGQVDTEAAFAAIAHGLDQVPASVGGVRSRLPGCTYLKDVLGQIEGSAALAWMDKRDGENRLHLARLWSSPLIVARTVGGSTVFASEVETIKLACEWVGLNIAGLTEYECGTYTQHLNGHLVDMDSFTPAGFTYRSTWWNDDDEWERYTSTRSRGSFVSVTSSDDIEWGEDDIPTVPTGQSAPRMDMDLLNVDCPVTSLGTLAYKRKYAMREFNIDRWYDDLRINDETAVCTFFEMGASLRPGDWVHTDLNGEPVFGQIAELPQTFPGGAYIIRTLVPSGRPNQDYEVVLLMRSHSEFEIAVGATKEYRDNAGQLELVPADEGSGMTADELSSVDR